MRSGSSTPNRIAWSGRRGVTPKRRLDGASRAKYRPPCVFSGAPYWTFGRRFPATLTSAGWLPAAPNCRHLRSRTLSTFAELAAHHRR